MSNEITQKDINDCEFLDVLRSLVEKLQDNCCKQVYVYTNSYFNKNPNDSEFHIVSESELPQIAIVRIISRELRLRRSLYKHKISNLENLTFKNIGRAKFFDFFFDLNILSTSANESSAIKWKIHKFWEDSDHLIDTISGKTYTFDMLQDDVFEIEPNISDLSVVGTQIKIGQVPVFGNIEQTGHLVETFIPNIAVN